MKQYKSHFKLSRQQRSGIFLFLGLVILFEIGVLFVLPRMNEKATDDFKIDPKQLEAFELEMDSLRKATQDSLTTKVFTFNPNFITDYKGYSLGMSNEQIDRLLDFRKQGKWINSKEQFQEVTLVSDSLLNIISPLFKFPDWVENPRPNPNFSNVIKKERPASEKSDLNIATEDQLEKVYGIGPALSKRILDERRKLGGFASLVELNEVYGLSQEVIDNLSNHFIVKTPRNISKINLNNATREELVKVRFIDYEIAYQIIEARTLKNGFQSIDELEKVKGFPVKKIDIIKLYLLLE